MAEHVRDIKRRIRSIQSTEQITKAMEMVAAVRLRRAQERVEAARPYAGEIRSMIERLVATFEELTHPLLSPREDRRTGYVVFTSDRGLCGAFNAHVMRLAQDAMRERETRSLVAIGRKGRDYFRRRDYDILVDFVGLGDEPSMDKAREIVRAVLNLYNNNVLDEIYLVYTQFFSTGKQRPVINRLLPVDSFTGGEDQGARIVDYIFEPDPERVLDIVLPRFVEAQVYRALLEAKASEFAARMLAMGNATENAKEIISQLTLSFNKARQAAITKELAEIVGGAEALKG